MRPNDVSVLTLRHRIGMSEHIPNLREQKVENKLRSHDKVKSLMKMHISYKIDSVTDNKLNQLRC